MPPPPPPRPVKNSHKKDGRRARWLMCNVFWPPLSEVSGSATGLSRVAGTMVVRSSSVQVVARFESDPTPTCSEFKKPSPNITPNLQFRTKISAKRLYLSNFFRIYPLKPSLQCFKYLSTHLCYKYIDAAQTSNHCNHLYRIRGL